MGKDDLMVVIGNHTVRDFTHSGIVLNIICLDGTLTMKEHTTILGLATVVGNVSMENLTFISSLHMLAPGEIFFREHNQIILALYATCPVVVHLRKGHHWKDFIYKYYGNGNPIEVRYDMD